jgi:hypothetical protein
LDGGRAKADEGRLHGHLDAHVCPDIRTLAILFFSLVYEEETFYFLK